MAGAVDISVLNTLKDQLGDSLEKLLQVFLDQVPNQLEDIESGLKAGDLKAAMRPAHTLKSSAATLGAFSLSELLKAIEMGARAGSSEGLVELLNQAREEFKSVQASLSVYIQGR